MPFGISGAPLAFQRLINSAFHGLLGDSGIAFLDDSIIVSKDVSSHMRKLEDVFTSLKSAGLTLRLTNCRSLQREIAFLVHVLDSADVHTTNEKVKPVLPFPASTNLETLLSFLGLSEYFNSFIKQYSTTARPLMQLTRKDEPF